MSNIKINALAIISLAALSGCAAFNTNEYRTNRTMTSGQELINLKKSLDDKHLTSAEYEMKKNAILHQPDITFITPIYMPLQNLTEQ